MLVSVSTLQADRGIWAIGDVHGCLRSLEALYARIAPRRCYLIGDLVGKGPDSKGVLDFAMRHSSIISMMGNHEDQLLKAYVDDTYACCSPVVVERRSISAVVFRRRPHQQNSTQVS